MIEINKLTKDFLMSSAGQQAVEKEVAQIVDWQDSKSAIKIVRAIKKAFGRMSKESDFYEQLLAKLQWTAFIQISEAEVLDLFTKHLRLGLDLFQQWERDLVFYLKGQLVSLSYVGQEELKQKISKIIEDNQELLTDKKIVIKDISDQSAVIKDILTDYRLNVINQPEEKLTLFRAEYYGTGKLFQSLAQSDKDKLKNLLNLYDFINTSALLPEGYAEDHIIKWPDGAFSLLDDGNVISWGHGEKVLSVHSVVEKDSQIDLSMTKEISVAYQGDPRQAKAIDKEQKKLVGKFNDNLVALRQEFFSVVQKKDINKTIAILKILAEKNDLRKFIAEDEKLHKFLALTWEKQYGPDIVKDFEANPADLKFIRLFLQYVLQERLNMSVSNAARVGLQIANIFVNLGQKEYNKMAYFDVKTKEFYWFE